MNTPFELESGTKVFKGDLLAYEKIQFWFELGTQSYFADFGVN